MSTRHYTKQDTQLPERQRTVSQYISPTTRLDCLGYMSGTGSMDLASTNLTQLALELPANHYEHIRSRFRLYCRSLLGTEMSLDFGIYSLGLIQYLFMRFVQQRRLVNTCKQI